MTGSNPFKNCEVQLVWAAAETYANIVLDYLKLHPRPQLKAGLPQIAE
jgi:hypothetical protein